jgi:hypothetical protein
MKKKILILSLIVCCLLLCSCGKKDNDTELLSNIDIEEIGIVKSDFGEDCLLLKAKNNNSKNLTLFTNIKLLDSSDKEVDSGIGMINLYPKQESYYVVEIPSEKEYKSYKLENEAGLNLYNDYENVYKKVKVEQTDSDDNEVINFTLENKSNKSVYAYVLGLFYKNNKIVATSEGHVDKTNVNEKSTESIYIPVKGIDSYEKIDYDRFELILKEVNYE